LIKNRYSRPAGGKRKENQAWTRASHKDQDNKRRQQQKHR
jgi:hypothetical protein